MKPPSKGILIAGGVVAAGAIWYIKRSEKKAEPAATEPAIAAPVTWFSSAGEGGFGGGGAPSNPGAPGTVTAPTPEHSQLECPPGTHRIFNVNAAPGVKPEGHCMPNEIIGAPPQLTCPSGTHKICNASALPGHSPCHCEPDAK